MASRIPKQPHSFEDVSRVVSLLFVVRRIMRTELAKQLPKGKKLDPSTWLWIETMKFISEHPEPKMKDVAAYLSITAPSTTSLVGDLVKNGRVACHTDRSDKRTSRLVLTAEGKRDLKKAMAHGRKVLGGLFNGLTPSELAAFASALERIKETEAGQ